MENLNIPKGYQTVMPYLILKDATQFQKFTEVVFDAKEKLKYMNDDNTIMHAEIEIGDSVIMFAESGAEWGTQQSGLFVYVKNADETYQKALNAGASSVMEISDRDYGKSGGIKDPCGNTWWITQTQE